MSLDAEIRIDLEQVGGNKSKLMQRYSERQQEIVKVHGGNLTDIPIDPEHEYHQIQNKLSLLYRMTI